MKSAFPLITAVGVAALLAALSHQSFFSTGAVREPSEPKNAAPVNAPAATAASATLSGRVLEKIDVAEYTYLRLQSAQQPNSEVWAAVNKAPIEVGADVVIAEPAKMEQFTSSTLKRTFETIYFGRLSGPHEGGGLKQGSAANGAGELPPGHPPLSGQGSTLAQPPAALGPHGGTAGPSSTPPVAVAEVERAPGPDGKTVSEVFEQRDAIAGKTIRVRGQVLKVTSGVMGKNYLRLRDGSGSGDTSELVVTTQIAAKPGDIVLLRGVVRTNVDVGIGYAYPVLLEDAVVASGS